MLMVLVIVIVVLYLHYKSKSRRTNGWWNFCFSRRGSHFYDRLPADGQGQTEGGEVAQQVSTHGDVCINSMYMCILSLSH